MHTIRVFSLRSFVALAICLVCVIATAATLMAAGEAKFQASLDRTKIAIGESCQLGLTFYGTQSMPAPDIDRIDGLEIRYLGPSTMMTVINGQVSSSITHMYSVVPLKTGAFQLGPFKFQQKNLSYVSNAVMLDVAEDRVATTAQQQVAAAPLVEKIDLGDRVYLTLEAAKLTGYVNELIPVTVRLYVNRMNVSDIQLPTFEQEEFSKVAFKEPRQYRQSIAGVLYDVLEFSTNIFGTKPGEYALGPAKLKCNVMIRKRLPRGPGGADDFFGDEFGRDQFFDDFYSRYERHPVELKTQAVKLIIQPLPAEGKPRDFSGAVGDYQFIVQASPTKVKAGDPITLNMSINGKGNFNSVIIPKLESIDGFRVYEPQIKTGENTKEFKQVIIPETAAARQIPALSFSFFNPYKKEYKTITQGPIAIAVEKSAEEAPTQVVGAVPDAKTEKDKTHENGAREIITIKESPGLWARKGRTIYSPALLGAFFGSPLALLAVLAVITGRRDRLRNDSVYAGRVAAFRVQKRALRTLKRELRSGDYRSFYEKLFAALQGYLGNRLVIPPAGITNDVIEAHLVAKNADIDIIRKVRNLFDACDRAKFAKADDSDMKAGSDLKEYKEIVEYLERIKI